jgi:hypothetical protein
MTDKQIACTYLNDRLWGMIPDHDHLRDIAESKLSQERCYRIVEQIIKMADRMRKPLVEHLNRAGLDTL